MIGVNVQSAKHPRKALVVFRLKDLITEHQHMVRVESIANLGELLRRQRRGEVDSTDHRADNGRQRVDRDRSCSKRLVMRGKSFSNTRRHLLLLEGNTVCDAS